MASKRPVPYATLHLEAGEHRVQVHTDLHGRYVANVHPGRAYDVKLTVGPVQLQHEGARSGDEVDFDLPAGNVVSLQLIDAVDQRPARPKNFIVRLEGGDPLRDLGNGLVTTRGVVRVVLPLGTWELVVDAREDGYQLQRTTVEVRSGTGPMVPVRLQRGR